MERTQEADRRQRKRAREGSLIDGEKPFEVAFAIQTQTLMSHCSRTPCGFGGEAYWQDPHML
jgi:hypothetical protein